MRFSLNFAVLFALLFLVDGKGGRDFYSILGVPRNAKEAQIKKAYRELSRKWHPDQNPDNKDEATEKFYDISAAYETLIDPEKRSKYDLGGEEAVNGAGGGGHGGFQRGDPFEQFNTFFQFFGGNGGGFHGGFPGGFPGQGGGFHEQHRPQAPNMYDEKSGVAEIGNANDWNAKIGQRSDVVVVDFYSPSCKPCQDLKEHYISIANKFSGIVQVMAVNCQGHTTAQICQSERVQNYPTIRIYLDNNKQMDFPVSQARTSKMIGNWISAAIPDYSSKIDSKSSLERFLSSSGSKAPVLLFSDKKETPAMFKSLCRTFKTNVACGVLLNHSPSSPPSFLPESIKAEVQKTPSLFYLHDPVSFSGELFKGSMTSEILSLFLSRVVSHRSRQVFVEQLTAARKEDCSSKDSSICVLLFGNPASNPTAGQKYDIMKQLAERFKSDPVKFFWVHEKSGFAAKFQGATAGMVLAYRGKRNKYSLFEAIDFSFETANSWIDNIVTGGSSLTLSPSKKPSHDEL